MAKTTIDLPEDVHEWLRENRTRNGRGIEWTIIHAVIKLMEEDKAIGDMADQEARR